MVSTNHSINSGGTRIFFGWGASRGGGNAILRGQKSKNLPKMADFGHFLLLTGGKWGQSFRLGGQMPPCLPLMPPLSIKLYELFCNASLEPGNIITYKIGFKLFHFSPPIVHLQIDLGDIDSTISNNSLASQVYLQPTINTRPHIPDPVKPKSCTQGSRLVLLVTAVALASLLAGGIAATIAIFEFGKCVIYSMF